MTTDMDEVMKAYNKGNEAFVADDYTKAIELYTEAIQKLPSGVQGTGKFLDCLISRAHAFTKAGNFKSAKKDADKAIELSRAVPDFKVELGRAFLRSGIASFQMGEYADAKNCFLEGEKVDPSGVGFGQWAVWCDEKLAKQKLQGKPIPEKVKEPETKSVSDEKPAKQESATAMPAPKIKHDWYQTETTVVVEVRAKGLKAEDVQVDLGETTLSVTAKLPASSTGSEYSLELDLAHPINPEQSSFRVLSTKIEIKLKKKDGIRWAALEGDGSVPLAAAGASAPTSANQLPPAYPSSRGKDWSKITSDIEKELAEDKPEGEAALQEMFNKIYMNADDETKRAMNKSYQESGGTVLSTNWAEIGKEKVEVKPPDGMEFKKWDS